MDPYNSSFFSKSRWAEAPRLGGGERFLSFKPVPTLGPWILSSPVNSFILVARALNNHTHTQPRCSFSPGVDVHCHLTFTCCPPFITLFFIFTQLISTIHTGVS